MFGGFFKSILIVGIGLAVSLLPLCSSALAKESADDLYNKGRFTEAEKAYSKLDMDNPKDIRFRYNRGAAAYQAGEYEKAAASFASVVRRAKDDEIKFKAVFNLGNTAFKSNDFESAKKAYMAAIQLNKNSVNARYNLELTIKELKKQKDDKDKKQDDHNKDHQKDNEKNQDQSKKDQSKDDQSKENQKDDKKSEDKNDQQDKDKQDEDQQAQPEEKKPQDLSGELSAADEQEARKAQQQEAEAAQVIMDKKKAEALLDNMSEDRSKYMKFLIPKDKRDGVESGKDW